MPWLWLPMIMFLIVNLSIVEQEACPTCGSCSGMFTANSMNCLNEAIGLALPGNGTIVATHKNRKVLFEKAAKQIVTITKKYYEEGDAFGIAQIHCHTCRRL